MSDPKCKECLDTGNYVQPGSSFYLFGYCNCEVGHSLEFDLAFDDVLAPVESVPPLVELL